MTKEYSEWKESIRKQFYEECTDYGKDTSLTKINISAENTFRWFWNIISEQEDEINEKRLLLDKANEKLKGNFSEVVSPAEPSDEEIEIQARKCEDYYGCDNGDYQIEAIGRYHGFIKGIDWLLNYQKAKAGSGGTPV